jgi:CubicO group peptidase (beta-lactamase class C family)
MVRRSLHRAAIVAVTLFAAPLATPLALPAQQSSRDSIARRVDRIFARWNSTSTPGCAVGVRKDGAVTLERGYGMASLEDAVAIRPGTIFQIGSVSKQFTTMAILLLARDGKLSLDDDVRKYIPELPDYGTRLTIRHMLSHTSGLRDEVALFYFAHGPRFLFTMADGVKLVARQKELNFAPGAEYLYSNSGYMLAAVVAERVSGQSLREFTAKRIFEPLGMNRSHIRDDYTEVVPGLATSYGPERGGGWHIEFPSHNVIGSTNVMTTVGDLLRWEGNFEHPVVGDGAMLEAMRSKSVLTNGDSIAYGLGLMSGVYRGLPTVAHSGSDQGYRSQLTRFPTQRLAVAVLCNAGSANPGALADRVADVYLDLAGVPPTDSVRPATIAPGALAAHAGVYLNRESGRALRLSVRDGELVQGRVPRSGGGGGTRIVPLSADRFSFGSGAEMVFPAPGRLELRATYPARVTDRLERVAPFAPRPGALAGYAGSYRSDELGTTYTITATDSSLVLTPPIAGGDELTVYPLTMDVFDGGPVVQFTRDSAGKIDGLFLTSPRSRRMRFVRVHGS